MLKNKLTITAAAIALVMLATACTTRPNSSLHNSFDYENALDRNPGFKKYLAKDKGDRISRELTLSYYADERRSAAIEEGGFKHTLANRNEQFNPEQYPSNVRYDLNRRYTYNTPTAHNSNVHDLFKTASIKDYSYYELGRWQRLCDGTNGRNMDRLDWRFVKRNKNKFPIEILDNCKLPSTEVLSRHGIRTPGERTSVRSTANDVLPNTVYGRIVKDHELANTPIPIVRSEPVIPCLDCPQEQPKKQAAKSKANKEVNVEQNDLRDDIFDFGDLKQI